MKSGDEIGRIRLRLVCMRLAGRMKEWVKNANNWEASPTTLTCENMVLLEERWSDAGGLK